MINSFDRKLDDKNRLILPVELRTEFPSGEAILTKGFDNTLALYAKEYWEAVVEPALEGDFTDESSFALNRRLNSDQVAVVVDSKRGRITLDQRFLDFAGITGNVSAFRVRTKTAHGQKWSYWGIQAAS
jgi:DNA-binding transcriptional regulator/RsmH inhibitor MraZ